MSPSFFQSEAEYDHVEDLFFSPKRNVVLGSSLNSSVQKLVN